MHFRYLPEKETKHVSEMRCLLTDIGNRMPIEILENREKFAFAGWLYRFLGRMAINM